jgi:hypothetical protein
VNAEAAWDALNEALQDARPACAGQALFTADSLTADQRGDCSSICARCPVLHLCGAYATAAKVTSGFWAGHSYSPKGVISAPGGSRQPMKGTP